MNCFKNLVIVAYLALFLLNTRTDAMVYNIPMALRQFQGFMVNESSVNDTVFFYLNQPPQNVTFELDIRKPTGSEATITFRDSDGQHYTFGNFSKVTFSSTSANLTLTGMWSGQDSANIYFQAPYAVYEDFTDRNATNLNVWGHFPLAFINSTLRIWANSTCRVKATTGGTYNRFPEGCEVTLNFAGGQMVNATVVGVMVTSTNNLMTFDVNTTCNAGDMVLYYMEDCSETPSSPPTTADSLKIQKSTALLVLCVLLAFIL
ncbi:unnamed protein product [Calicophoron daubneyi]|uniref:Uncharacterized protein n=1 Tax=Calicophoron daubneyi TaxID=300641 RepID=A0AAV2TVV6_CALDB